MSGLKEKIAQFVSVTGCSEEMAKRYLDACSGNVDMAVGMHMENNAFPPPTGAVAAETKSVADNERPKPVLSPKSYKEIHGVRAPIPQTSGVLIEEQPEMSRRITRSRRLPQTVFDPFQDYAAVAAKRGRGGGDVDGKAKAKRNLAELFRPPHELLFSGSFEEAKQAGCHKRCWLLVNLQDSREFSCQILNRDLWSSPAVRELVQSHFVFIQIYRVNDDGTRFRQLYHTESYPTIAIIDPRTGELMMSWGTLTADKFVKEARNFLASNPFAEDGSVDCATGSIINASEQSQLEAAIQASLENIKHRTVVITSDSSDTEGMLATSEEEGEEEREATSQVVTRSKAVRSVGRASCNNHHKMATNQRDRLPLADILGSRKRKPVVVAEDCMSTRKRPKTDPDPVCNATNNIELLRLSSVENVGVDRRDDRARKQEGGGGEGERGGGRGGKRRRAATSKESSGDTISAGKGSTAVDPHGGGMVERGELQKDQVSQILFRMPDGSRLLKTFLSTACVRELVEFVEQQGLKVTEYDIVTHFPKRSILEMDQKASLKQCGLHPKDTVFVHHI